MKKTLFLFLALFTSSNTHSSHTITNTGFYGVYVESMPFWTFWNRPKAIKLIAKYAQKSIADTKFDIDCRIPIFYTWNHNEAEALQAELKKINCDLEIRELSFTCEDDDKETALNLQMMKFGREMEELFSSRPDMDRETALQAILELAENKESPK